MKSYLEGRGDRVYVIVAMVTLNLKWQAVLTWFKNIYSVIAVKISASNLLTSSESLLVSLAFRRMTWSQKLLGEMPEVITIKH